MSLDAGKGAGSPELPPGLFDITCLAARLNCSPRTAWRIIRRKEIPSLKIGRLTRVNPADVEAYIASRVSR